MRSYVFRLPLFTRLVVFAIVLLWILSIQSFWKVQECGALIPNEIGFSGSESLSPYLLRDEVVLGADFNACQCTGQTPSPSFMSTFST